MTRACLALAIACVCGLTASVSAQSVSLPVDAVMQIATPGERVTSPALALLRRRVEEVDWIERTFEEVIDWLRDQAEGRVNVIVRWGPLNVEGVGRETLVTLRMNNSTVAQVLNETLDQLSETGELAYRGFDNTLWLSSRQDFGRKMYLRVYDVTDILFRVPDFGRDAPLIDLQQVAQQGAGGGGGGGGQGVFGGSSSSQSQQQGGEQAERELEDRLQELQELVEKAIEPSSWQAGGGRGQIAVFNRSLIVYNTIEVHEMIAGEFTYGG